MDHKISSPLQVVFGDERFRILRCRWETGSGRGFTLFGGRRILLEMFGVIIGIFILLFFRGTEDGKRKKKMLRTNCLGG